ncbi:MAG: hypothetical protein AB1938_22215 [Myxococcota bacterium]
MPSVALEELGKLRAFAERRLANPHGQQLCHALDDAACARALVDRPLVPWEMSLGFYTPHWAHFSEQERLALNHWTYAMMYFRIGDGERFVVTCNRVVADALESVEPRLCALLRLEADEEEDHIAAFGRVFSLLQARHGFAGISMPKKPLRPLLVSKATVRFLTRVFGADFVISYFLGRGLVNHMGKAFEMGVQGFDQVDASLRRLSLLHTVDENRHMAVSRMMAACTYELIHERRARNPLYDALNQAMQHTMLRYTFSDAITTGQERAMSHRALPRMVTLASVPRDVLATTIDAHFAGVTGIEAAKNEFMPRFNQRLLDRAGLAPSEKQAWFRLLVSLQRNLRFFPDGYTPGRAEDTPGFDDEVLA